MLCVDIPEICGGSRPMKTKILLVDDDPNIRQLVHLYLEKGGFRRRPRRSRRRRPLEIIQIRCAEPDPAGSDAARHGRLAGAAAKSAKPRTCPSSCSPPRTRPSTRCSDWSWARTITSSSPSTPKELLARIKAVLRRFQPAADAGFQGTELSRADHQSSSQYTVTYMG